ncbi:sugar phosphate isomerase/epimerase [Brucella gallinifaecis]|uniref:sugar phosphate isomerase/epimerase family protein n=1 Tax=Brucella gallinifaecis TaxID=215590 RepID=UPI002361E534|nr:TIM barrel protein [Brucella gallinifaecis]
MTAKTMNISLAHLSMIDAAPEDLIGAALAGGFNGIGLRLTSTMALPAGVDLASDRTRLKRFKTALADNGLRVLDVEAFALTAQTQVLDFESALDAAAELGAKSLLCVIRDDEIHRRIENFSQLCQLAAKRGITVGLEFIPYMAVRTIAEAKFIIDKSDQQNAAFLIDVLHLSRSGGQPEDLQDLDIAFIQLCDARSTIPSYDQLPSEARTDRLYPGEGALWLDRLSPYLSKATHISVEAPVKADASLSFAERGLRLGSATQAFLVRHGITPNTKKAEN